MSDTLHSPKVDLPTLQLHVIQADYGDCLLLQYNAAGLTRHILIDGGPDGIYANHLKYKLEEIAALHGRLDLVAVTHIDEDHVVGLVDMFSEMAQAKGRGEPPLVEVDRLWYNTFRPIDNGVDGSSDVVETFTAYLSGPSAGGEMQSAAYSISQGEDLWKAAHVLRIPLNADFTHKVIIPDNAPHPVDFDGLKLWVIGPTRTNLNRYKRDWDKWFIKHKNDPYSDAAVNAAREIDTSVSNLSSLMFLAEVPGWRLLFTGDGNCDDVMKGLKRAGLTDPDGKIHVDVLKVPHHGSLRNNSRVFFQKVTASKYVIPAGKHKNDGNPDLNTLIWIVESAVQRGEHVDILVTNPNDNTSALLQKYPIEKYDYTLTFLAPGQHSTII